MANKHPVLIQGGMGIGLSDWKLAQTVSKAGQLGLVSGSGINSVFVRRLQDGDPSGMMRQALKAFPNRDIAQKILELYYIEGGKAKGVPYKRAPLYSIQSPKALLQLTVAATFAEVYAAKQGHSNPVGINLMEKIQLPTLPCAYGAMLAGVDYIIMGAGIPREMPGALDLFSQNLEAKFKVPVEGGTEDIWTKFNPAEVMDGANPMTLKRPNFFPIVSSSVLAASLKKKSTGEVQGFVVEGPLAGGHNAPPRGPLKLNELGEPIYGERDQVKLSEMVELGLPFWMAGYYATPEKLKAVQAEGAHGIQVGTMFAFSKESGLSESLKKRVVGAISQGIKPPNGWVYTDPHSSPTGFPFKAVRLEGTVSEKEIYEKRRRICDLGYLRHAYQKAEGGIGLRCSAEPVEDYVKKGGKAEDTLGKKCLCNALFANVNLGQTQSWGDEEIPLLTAGDDLNDLGKILKPGQDTYSAQDVINFLLSSQ